MSVKRVLLAALIGLCLIMLASPILAQGGAIQIGQNATGTLSAAAVTAQFTVTAQGGETAAIQVLALSQGFVPSFSVANPAGVQILNVANADGKATLSGNVSFSDPGAYTITIAGVNGSTGQFVLSLQAGAPLPPPVALTINQPVTGTVGAQTPVLIYSFDTSSLGAVGLVVLSQTPNAGALVTVVDTSLGKTVASSDAGVVGAAYQLPANAHAYQVQVRADGSSDTAFSICIGTCAGGLAGGTTNAPPTPAPNVIAPPNATPEPSAGCSATSSAGGAVNLRSGPGTQYAPLSQLPLGQSAQVLAQWNGRGWYEVNVNGAIFWVGGSVVSLSGDCSTLPLIPAPAGAPLAPTRVPQPPVSTPDNGGDNGGGDNSGNNGGNNGGDNGGNSGNLPNLTITNVQISNPGNGTVDVSITVINSGTAPVDNPYAVKTCIDNDNCDEITGFAAGLQPGDTMNFSDEIPFTPDGGNHTVLVTVDSQHQVKESNESDNDAFSSFNL